MMLSLTKNDFFQNLKSKENFMQRTKRERACKSETFPDENSEEYINLTNEMMFNFLERHRNLKITLSQGRIKQSDVKDSIVRCCLGYPIDTPDQETIVLNVHFTLNEKGECPFNLQKPDLRWAGVDMTYVAFVALGDLPCDYVLELKCMDRKLKTFELHDVYRKIAEEDLLPKKKFRSISENELLALEMDAEIRKQAEKLFLENDQSVREEAINKLALEFKQEAKREYENALAESRRLLLIQIEQERQKRLQELEAEIQERANLIRLSDVTAEIPK